jgi:hypothetical protein
MRRRGEERSRAKPIIALQEPMLKTTTWSRRLESRTAYLENACVTTLL